jgi:hypothetical protein
MTLSLLQFKSRIYLPPLLMNLLKETHEGKNVCGNHFANCHVPRVLISVALLGSEAASHRRMDSPSSRIRRSGTKPGYSS